MNPEFLSRLYFPKEQRKNFEARLKMFNVKFEAETVPPKFSPPAKMLKRVLDSGDLMCYQITSDPPLIPDLIQSIEQRKPENKLESVCLNLHEDGLKFGLAVSIADFEGSWREFVTPEGTFMKLDHLFVPRTKSGIKGGSEVI